MTEPSPRPPKFHAALEAALAAPDPDPDWEPEAAGSEVMVMGPVASVAVAMAEEADPAAEAAASGLDMVLTRTASMT